MILSSPYFKDSPLDWKEMHPWLPKIQVKTIIDPLHQGHITGEIPFHKATVGRPERIG